MADVKEKIHKLLNSIEDEETLNQVMEDVMFYKSQKKVVSLKSEQAKELQEAIKEADNNEVISWDDFKKEINGWKGKL
jgi:peptidyl-tRNA hydrolase